VTLSQKIWRVHLSALQQNCNWVNNVSTTVSYISVSTYTLNYKTVQRKSTKQEDGREHDDVLIWNAMFKLRSAILTVPPRHIEMCRTDYTKTGSDATAKI